MSMWLVQSQKALLLEGCSARVILKFIIIVEPKVPHFYFALGPTNYMANLGYTYTGEEQSLH